MNYLEYALGYLEKGQRVQVTLDAAANVSIMDYIEKYNYAVGNSHRYIGGHITRSPYIATIPYSGTWYCCVDLGGYAGSVNASCKTLPSLEEEEERIRQQQREERRKEVESAERIRRQEEETRNIKELMEKVDAGDMNARHYLAIRYEHGNGFPQSYQKAAEWYTAAAEQGNSASQYNLAGLYFNGNGVEKSIEKAFEYYEKAAAQNYTDALQFLAEACETGEQITANYEKSFG
jgi:hypothetical protein